MGVALGQQLRIGAYILKQRLCGNRRYPLVLMLEPLFRCNLACAGCGKIDYPDPILDRRMSVADAVGAVEECGAPVVSIAGGEPLIHREIGGIVAAIVARKKYVYLCTNALLLEKKLDLFEPSPFFSFSIHLDGTRAVHDRSVCQDGVYDAAIRAIAAARAKGFRVSVNCTLFDGVDAGEVAEFFDSLAGLGVDGVTVSPGYAYERAPDQQHFLNRRKTKELFRAIFARGRGRKWPLSHSALYLDFLAGNRDYRCTPWGNPTRNVFGWQRPCYLLGEGYAPSFRELMDGTDWDSYGTGNYEKCADCMAHCGYEASAVADLAAHPWKALPLALFGIRTEGKMAPEIPLEGARPAQFTFGALVEERTAALAEESEIRPARRDDAAERGERAAIVDRQRGQRREFARPLAQLDENPGAPPAAGGERRCRDASPRRVGDRADGDRRQPGPGHRVAFHVDGGGARGCGERGLGGGVRDRRVGPGDRRADDGQRGRQRGGEPVRPFAGDAERAAVRSDDAGGDHHRPRRQPGI